MNKSYSDINSADSVRISILQFLQTETTPNLQIRKIRAGENVSIEIEQFFHSSADYQKLNIYIDDRINALGNNVDGAGSAEEKEHEISRLNKLRELFKIDVLSLAKVFIGTPISSERLAQAKELFEKGRFAEAGNVLNAEELLHDHETLILITDYLEKRNRDLITALKVVS